MKRKALTVGGVLSMMLRREKCDTLAPTPVEHSQPDPQGAKTSLFLKLLIL